MVEAKEIVVIQEVQVAVTVENVMEEEVVEVTVAVIPAVAALLIAQASRLTVLVVKALQFRLRLLYLLELRLLSLFQLNLSPCQIILTLFHLIHTMFQPTLSLFLQIRYLLLLLLQFPKIFT